LHFSILIANLLSSSIAFQIPSLWKTSIIPKDRSMIISQFAFLDILSDRVGGLLGGHFHLCLGVFRDLIDEVVKIPVFEGDIMPW
jgi:hypothetical protein